jgi:hypothetical protein
MEWERTQGRIQARGFRCHHVGGQMIAGGVRLSCCGGTAITCKEREFRFLLELLESKCEQIDTLKEQIGNLQAKPTVVVNNSYTMNVHGVDIARNAMRGQDIYALAAQELSKAPPSEQSVQLLQWYKSNDICDRLNYKREVMNLISESTDAFVDGGGQIQRTELEAINNAIENEQNNITTEAVQIGIAID